MVSFRHEIVIAERGKGMDRETGMRNLLARTRRLRTREEGEADIEAELLIHRRWHNNPAVRPSPIRCSRRKGSSASSGAATS